MAKRFEDLWKETMEYRAAMHYFLATGRNFDKLPPTEQRKRIEIETEKANERVAERRKQYDRESEGNFSLIPGPGRNNGSFDIPE